MSLLNLFFDISSKRLVNSLNNSGLYLLPEIHQEDIWTITLTACQRINFSSPPFYSVLNIADYALQISVGTVGTVNAQQSSWDRINNDQQFSGSLNFNTASINALADSVDQTIEIRLTATDAAYHALQTVKYRKIVAPTGTVAPIAGDRALGVNEADQRYLTYENNGFTLVSQDGTKRAFIYLDNDGSLRGPPIVPI